MTYCILLYYYKLKIKKRIFLSVRTIAKATTKKKTKEFVKEELLSSILQAKDKDDLDVDLEVQTYE